MTLYCIEAAAIPHEWGWLGATLAGVVALDDKRDLDAVYHELVAGRFAAWVVTGDGATGVIVTSLGHLPGQRIGFWINYVRGGLSGGPKARLLGMRGLMVDLEHKARALGACEMRLEGRDWGDVLEPLGFERTLNVARNELRKVL